MTTFEIFLLVASAVELIVIVTFAHYYVTNARPGHRYLEGLFRSCAPECTPFKDLPGLATQLDNYITGQAMKIEQLEKELEDEVQAITPVPPKHFFSGQTRRGCDRCGLPYRNPIHEYTGVPELEESAGGCYLALEPGPDGELGDVVVSRDGRRWTKVRPKDPLEDRADEKDLERKEELDRISKRQARIFSLKDSRLSLASLVVELSEAAEAIVLKLGRLRRRTQKLEEGVERLHRRSADTNLVLADTNMDVLRVKEIQNLHHEALCQARDGLISTLGAGTASLERAVSALKVLLQLGMLFVEESPNLRLGRKGYPWRTRSEPKDLQDMVVSPEPEEPAEGDPGIPASERPEIR